MKKCQWPGNVTVRLDGIHDLDPCIYDTIEKHANVTVEVRKCRNCGHIDIAWYRQEDTVDLDPEEE